jgi:hypothetical protein
LVGFVGTRAGGDGVNLVVVAVVNRFVAVGAGGEDEPIARIVGVVVMTDVGGVGGGVGGVAGGVVTGFEVAGVVVGIGLVEGTLPQVSVRRLSLMS